jgi:hypothetical protein
VYALCTLALAYPILVGKFLVSPISDEYIAGYAFREYGAAMLRSTGHFPLWNPYLFGGLPFVAAMHGDIFYPTFILRALMPTDLAMSLAFALHLFLAGLFTYLFLRVAGLSFFASLVGGVAYMLSGIVAGLAAPGHDGKLYVSAIFPLALWLLTHGVRDGRRWAWGVLAIAVGLAVLSPHPQLLQYMLLASGSYALYLAISEARAGRIDRGTAIRRLAFALGAVVLGMAIGAIQFLPVQQYVPWSPRAGGRGYDFATSFSFPPEELINTYLPQFSGLLTAYWGRNLIHFHSEYLGVVALFLAGAGLGAAKTRGFVRFWIGVLIIGLLWALGRYTPFYHLVYALVPGSKFFRAPSTIFYLVAFSVAVLAAYGMERVLAREIGMRYAVGWLIGGVVVALLATAGVFTNLGISLVASMGRDGMVQANAGAVTMGAWRSFLFVLVAALVLMSFINGRLNVVVAGCLLTAATAADLWSIERRYWMFSQPAKVLYATNPVIDYIKAQDKIEPGRVYGFPLALGYALHDPMFGYDGFMIHRVREVAGYHGNELGRYEMLIHSSDLGVPKPEEAAHILLAPNIARLTNLKYFVTNTDQLPQPLAGLTKVVGPVEDAAGSTIYLYRMPGENPPAWVARAILKAPDDQVLAAVMDSSFNPASMALFDTSAAVQAQQLTAQPPPLDLKAHITHYEPGRITVHLDAPAPAGSALMVSENYYPGWQATVDGKPATIGRADFTLIGVELPAGARDIELTFHSSVYEVGKTITLVALALSVALILVGIAAERRRRA